MLIQVTQEDINNGRRGNCYYCPVALAVARIFNAHNFIYVGAEGICDVRKWTVPVLPPEVFDFICKFDRQFPVAPFTFELQIPA